MILPDDVGWVNHPAKDAAGPNCLHWFDGNGIDRTKPSWAVRDARGDLPEEALA